MRKIIATALVAVFTLGAASSAEAKARSCGNDVDAVPSVTKMKVANGSCAKARFAANYIQWFYPAAGRYPKYVFLKYGDCSTLCWGGKRARAYYKPINGWNGYTRATIKRGALRISARLP